MRIFPFNPIVSRNSSCTKIMVLKCDSLYRQVNQIHEDRGIKWTVAGGLEGPCSRKCGGASSQPNFFILSSKIILFQTFFATTCAAKMAPIVVPTQEELDRRKVSSHNSQVQERGSCSLTCPARTHRSSTSTQKQSQTSPRPTFPATTPAKTTRGTSRHFASSSKLYSTRTASTMPPSASSGSTPPSPTPSGAS